MIKRTAGGWLVHNLTNRGITAWLLSAALLIFYVVVYFGSTPWWSKENNFQRVSFHSSFTWLFMGFFVGAMILALHVMKRESSADETQLKWVDVMTRVNLAVLVAYLLFAFIPPRTTKVVEGIGILSLYLFAGGVLTIIFSLFRARSEENKRNLWIHMGAFFAVSVFVFLFIYNIVPYHESKGAIPEWLLHTLFYGMFGYLFLSTLFGMLATLKFRTSESTDILLDLLKFAVLLAIVYLTPWFFYWVGWKLDYFEIWGKAIFGLKSGNRWMLYGFAYSITMLIGGAYMIWKYRHNKYQIVRTCVVVLVQIIFGFSIPWMLKMAQKPDYYFSYIWPLKIGYFNPSTIKYQITNGLPVPVVIYSFVAGLVLAPVMAVMFGKRWYCSWVCGCGGLANTLGEPWRHLSSKSTTSWKIERFTIHAVLVFSLVTTAVTFLAAFLPQQAALVKAGTNIRSIYGVGVTAVLSGVVGVGLYPIGGTRVWCRFACPMAALLGLLQKFGRFQIRVKRDMCISCGMCSKYCEMGIDVRSYAQANQTFTRASCVGCGLCAEVCPRGVLRLENVNKKDPQEMSLVDMMNEWKGPEKLS